MRLLGTTLGALLGAVAPIGVGAISMVSAGGCDGGSCVALLALGLVASPFTAAIGGVLGFLAGRAIANRPPRL